MHRGAYIAIAPICVTFGEAESVDAKAIPREQQNIEIVPVFWYFMRWDVAGEDSSHVMAGGRIAPLCPVCCIFYDLSHTELLSCGMAGHFICPVKMGNFHG
jgi:hypothetical protein